MANTYTQLFVHIVFVVQSRDCLIKSDFREELQKYITGLVSNSGNKLYSIYCMPDHTHVFVSLNPNVSVSALVQKIKASSAKFINENRLVAGKFNWQSGFAAFTYAKSQTQIVNNYINKQKEHHHKRTFKEEYIELLKKFEIDYGEKYLFTWVDVS